MRLGRGKLKHIAGTLLWMQQALMTRRRVLTKYGPTEMLEQTSRWKSSMCFSCVAARWPIGRVLLMMGLGPGLEAACNGFSKPCAVTIFSQNPVFMDVYNVTFARSWRCCFSSGGLHVKPVTRSRGTYYDGTLC